MQSKDQSLSSKYAIYYERLSGLGSLIFNASTKINNF